MTDPIAILTGVLVGLMWLDLKPSRIEAYLFILGTFIWIAWGVNFQIDSLHGAHPAILNPPAVIHFLDDKPAKLRLEMTRFAGAMLWLCLTYFGPPALRRLYGR